MLLGYRRKEVDSMAKGKYEYWLMPEGLLNTWKDKYLDISDTLKRGKE